MPRFRLLAAVLSSAFTVSCSAPQRTAQTSSLGPPLALVDTTDPVADDADDPAVWVNPTNAADSLIFGTNKVAAPKGALYVYGMDGSVRQVVGPIDRPNNVDIEYGLPTGAGSMDIAVVSERLQQRLRVFRVDAKGVVAVDGGGVPVCEGEAGEAGMPMGVALYRRAQDGAIFAIVAPKTGGRSNYLWQYRLTTDDHGVVRGSLVRRFGNFSGNGEIEAVVVDDELGYVYYADEEFALHKWSADPDAADADRELAVFGQQGFTAQREGLAILPTGPGRGFLIVSDQIPDATELRVYRREGRARDPHDHTELVASIPTTADSTDGIDVSARNLGSRFPAGVLLMMSSRERAFRMHDLAALLSRIQPSRQAARRQESTHAD